MALVLNGVDQYVKRDYPASISGEQDFTLFYLIETTTPPNDTGTTQQTLGMHDDSAGFRYLGGWMLDDTSIQCRQRLSGGSIIVDGPNAVAATLYAVCIRWETATDTLKMSVNGVDSTVGSSSLTALPVEALVFGASFGGSGFASAGSFFKGRAQYCAQWTGTQLSDSDVDDLTNLLSKPDEVTTAPDYYYELINDLNSDVGGDPFIAFGSATTDGVDLWPAVGQTLTGPDTTTEGSVTVATGTGLDTVTTFNLVSGSNSVVQSIDSATATTLNYVARSGVSLCTPSTSIAGLPLEPTISAAGITPYVVQQEAE